jgi:hypothetical protein
MLIALLAIDPGGMMPEREFVVAELASRSPCGMRVRVEALVWVCASFSHADAISRDQTKCGGVFTMFSPSMFEFDRQGTGE